MKRIRVAVDECISPRLARSLAALYERFEFMPVRDLVPEKTGDEVWAERFKTFGGRVVLSGDVNIAKRPHQAAAFIANGFISFFPSGSWARLKRHQQAAHLVHAWPRAAQLIDSKRGASCWRIICKVKGNTLTLDDSDFDEMGIPPDVMREARKQAGN